MKYHFLPRSSLGARTIAALLCSNIVPAMPATFEG
jgi:hypothetical protein